MRYYVVGRREGRAVIVRSQRRGHPESSFKSHTQALRCRAMARDLLPIEEALNPALAYQGGNIATRRTKTTDPVSDKIEHSDPDEDLRYDLLWKHWNRRIIVPNEIKSGKKTTACSQRALNVAQFALRYWTSVR